MKGEGGVTADGKWGRVGDEGWKEVDAAEAKTNCLL